MFGTPLPVSPLASRQSLSYLRNSLTLLFPATSKTSQKSKISCPLTPFFSTNRHHSSSLFFTLEQISPLFAHSSQKYPGVHPLLSQLLNHYLNFPVRSLITSLLHYRPFHFGIAPVTSRPRSVRSVTLWQSFCLPPSVAAHPTRCDNPSFHLPVPGERPAFFTRHSPLVTRHSAWGTYATP